jgi:hypothetical protein
MQPPALDDQQCHHQSASMAVCMVGIILEWRHRLCKIKQLLRLAVLSFASAKYHRSTACFIVGWLLV